MRFLTLLYLFASSILLSGLKAEDTTRVEQLVVVYAPSYDPGGDFSPLHSILEPLLQTAEKHKLKVIMYPADLPNTEEGKKELIRKLGGLVKDRSSWVYLAAHGRAVPNAREAKDTLLLLPGNTLLSELSPFLNHPNVKGTLISACGAFTAAATNTNNIVCASSFPGKISDLNHDVILMNSLSTLIGAGPTDPAKTLSTGIREALKRNPKLQDAMVQDEGNKSFLPIAESPIPKKYIFGGEKYEVVDENDEKVDFCPVKVLEKVAGVIGTLADHAYLINNVGYMLPGLHPIKPQSLPSLDIFPALRCKKGKWTFVPPKECVGVETTVESCEKSFEEKHKWSGTIDRAMLQRQCGELRDGIKSATDQGIEFPKSLCFTGCFEDLLATPTLSHTAPTACSPGGSGQQCRINLFNAPISTLPQTKECCGNKYPKTYEWNAAGKFCNIRCYDPKQDKVVGRGTCFVSELPLSMKHWGEFVTDPEPIWECAANGISLGPRCCDALPHRIFRGGECQFLDQKAATFREHQ
jgi:hypothetical protein